MHSWQFVAPAESQYGRCDSMINGLSVLVVDDEVFIRQILSRIVSREGYSVAEANDGVEALEKMADRHFDFVISDIQMPRMGGMELLAKIKGQYTDTRVLLITGYGGADTADEVSAAGADCFITKPFKNVEISRTLTALRQKSAKSVK